MLKAVVDALDDIPAHFHELYTEKGGKFEFTGVEGIKSQADIDRLQGALTKEREDHKKVRTSLSAWGDHKPEDVLSALDRIPELEAAAEGKLDENKINSIVEGRLRQKLSPLEREREQLRTQLQEREQLIEGFTAKERTRAIHDAVREAAGTAKVLPEAMEDALMLAERHFEVTEDGRVVTKDGVGVTPGIEAKVWFTDLQKTRAHWWGPSAGGGAGGNRGTLAGQKNPFSRDNWNMTDQGKLVRENRALAEQMATAAGTTIGGAMPAK